ncbi:hypothetical protein [uncultured Methylobacterium sp.]|uniref:hypothetical protein n=1 Tax=uncultured Methylobacterium sp. TaxID=157278 RepID=UPI002635F2BA|nr:hypothetical protein [uncultured Methylobacterium sp.]
MSNLAFHFDSIPTTQSAATMLRLARSADCTRDEMLSAIADFLREAGIDVEGLGFHPTDTDTAHLKVEAEGLRAELRDAVARADQAKDRIRDLAKQLEAVSAERDRYRDAYNESEDHVGSLPSVATDGRKEYVNFSTVEQATSQHLGRSWRALLGHHIGMSVAELNAWRVVGIFPLEQARQAADLISHEPSPPSRQRWTSDEVLHLKKLLDQGRTDLEAARTLSDAFGRVILETSVLNQRRKLFRDTQGRPRTQAHRKIVPHSAA